MKRAITPRPLEQKHTPRLRTGFAPLPRYTLEINDDQGKLADIPFTVEPLRSDRTRAQRAGAIAILIALLMQRPSETNFTNLEQAVGFDSADAVRRLAIGANVDRFRCRLLDEQGRHLQVLHTHAPEYAVRTGNKVSIDAIAQLAKEQG